MRLKSIKLAGFKSFVDATTVSFPYNMTAIVGPNGCGKSNVIDAVRWVMGESSAKNLRGESMTDVIFNGSSARQPVGQASIELVFDNTSGKLQGEYAAFSEISIRRKVTREGLSQYYLNGSKCRRRDVTDIFLGTGMGPRSYAIIEQGMISRLIESKPEELRVYLEEAAGISKYKERRRETENRIARTQENLERLSDIRDELGKQLAHLQRQAKAAERYKEYRQSERWLNAKLNTLEWQGLDEQAKTLRAAILRAETAIEKSVLDRTENEGLIETLRLSHETHQEGVSAIQAKYYESGADIAKLEQEIKYRKERMQQRTSALAKLALERATLSERLTETRRELEESSGEAEVILPELELQQERLEALNEQLAQGIDALEQWQSQWEAFDQRYHQSVRQRQVSEDKLSQLKRSVEDKQKRIVRLESEREELSALLDEVDDAELVHVLAELDAKVSARQNRCDELLGLLERSNDELERLREQKSSKAQALSERQAVLASLKTLQASALRRQQGNDAGVLSEFGIDPEQRLYSQLTLDKAWEPAVEHVLGDFLNAICCDQLVLPQEAVARLSSHVSLLDLSSSEGTSIEPGSLAEAVSGASGLSVLLNQVHKVDTLDDAMQRRAQLKEGHSLIVSDGTWVGREWVRYYKPATESVGLVSREQEIAETSEIVETLSAEVAQLEAAAAEAQELVRRYQGESSQQQRDLQLCQAERSKRLAEKSAQDARNEQRSLRMNRNYEDLEELREQLGQDMEQTETERCLIEEAAFEIEELEQERDRYLERKRRIQGDNDELSQTIRRLQNEAHALQLNQQKKLNQQNMLEMSLRRLEEDLARVESEHEDIAASEDDEDHVEELDGQLEGLLDRRLAIESRLSEAKNAMEVDAQALKEAEHRRSDCERTIQQQRTELEQRRMEKQAIDINQAAFKEKVEVDEYALEQLLEALESEDTVPALKQELATLAQKIQRLGAINLAAVDEYKEQSERKEYLDAQNDELTEALETLLAAIRKIDKETRARFKETYDQVNEGLQRLFPRIFGGGSAYLDLTDADLLETGVSIIARPPGKKNSTIHLLSGGEKALTAIALIFAIFELNPAPFCMLDEVDAPLDDANVGRFARIVKEMSDRVQFIYISHNKVSMEKADQLMGVTMSEPGCSRLVSVDVEEAVSLAEA